MAVVELQKTVTSSLDDEELSVIVDSIVDAYGVDEEELQIEVVYQTTGSVVLGDLGDVSEEEVLATIEDELALILGVHESEISVTLEDGVVYYTISSSSVEAAETAQSVLDTPSAAEQLSVGLENLEVVVTSLNVDEEIVADIVVTVDTSNASNNLSQAAETLGSTLEAGGFIASVESTIFFFLKHVVFEMCLLRQLQRFHHRKFHHHNQLQVFHLLCLRLPEPLPQCQCLV